MANILTYGGYRICYGENQTSYGEYPIAYGGNHIAYGGNQIVMAKSRRSMAKIIHVGLKLSGGRSHLAEGEALWRRPLFSLRLLLHSA